MPRITLALPLAAAFALCLASPALAGGGFKRLHADKATASSFLKNNWNRFSENYHPSYVLDDDPRTAWVEGAEGDGHGEQLSWRISTLKSAKRVKLRIKNGYQKSKKLFGANAVPRKVEIALLSAGGGAAVTKTVELKKKMGWQDVVLDVPAGKGIAGVRLTVRSTYPGRVYKDTCLSDVQTWVESDVTYNEKAEQVKQARLRSWVKERRAEAAYFKKLPREYPFAATHLVGETLYLEDSRRVLDYDDKGEPIVTKGWRPMDEIIEDDALPEHALDVFGGQVLVDFKLAKELAATGGKAFGERRYKIEYTRSLRLPDGFEVNWPYASFVPSFRDLLDAGAFSLAETSKKGVGRSRAYPKPDPNSSYGPEEWLKRWDVTSARARHAESGALQALYFSETQVIEERGVYKRTVHHVVLFDGKQRVERVLAYIDGTDTRGFYRLAFERDDAGQIHRIAYREARAAAEFNLGDESSSNHLNAVDFTAPRVAKK
jgi:hypothetical protein